MTVLEWALISSLGVLYFVMLFTVAVLTFRKGHFLLFFLGIIFPIFWLIGAVTTPKHRL